MRSLNQSRCEGIGAARGGPGWLRVWMQLPSAEHERTLVLPAATFAVLCLLALLGYGYAAQREDVTSADQCAQRSR